MTLAIWDITTITSNAANTHFGVAGRWEEIPDMYPPIGFMFTSTTPGARTVANAFSSYGLFIEYQCTTSGGANSLTCGTVRHMPLQARAYQKGTRWFSIATAIRDGDLPSSVHHHTNPVKRLILYYRAMDEYGETPS